MALTVAEVEHIAKLAKLKLSKLELEKFGIQLSKVIEHIKELSEVETDGVEPTSQTTGLTDVLREDEIDETQMTPQDGHFVVAKILDK
ncbi:MAG: Asp-tRNA(Asn)/Glu-tRNA(Gln) amidotransferase subunit GatC [Patescibacteria group bacterium]